MCHLKDRLNWRFKTSNNSSKSNTTRSANHFFYLSFPFSIPNKSPFYLPSGWFCVCETLLSIWRQRFSQPHLLVVSCAILFCIAFVQANSTRRRDRKCKHTPTVNDGFYFVIVDSFIPFKNLGLRCLNLILTLIMAQEEQMTMAVSSGNSFSSSNFNSETFWQHIIALDVQFNQWRSFGNYLSECWCQVWSCCPGCLMLPCSSHLSPEMLYIKRRNQLFRDLSRSELNSFRRRYIKLRYTILSKKYQTDCDQQQQLSVSSSSWSPPHKLTPTFICVYFTGEHQKLTFATAAIAASSASSTTIWSPLRMWTPPTTPVYAYQGILIHSNMITTSSYLASRRNQSLFAKTFLSVACSITSLTSTQGRWAASSSQMVIHPSLLPPLLTERLASANWNPPRPPYFSFFEAIEQPSPLSSGQPQTTSS